MRSGARLRSRLCECVQCTSFATHLGGLATAVGASSAWDAEIHMVVFVMPDPGRPIVECDTSHCLSACASGSELRLQIDIKNDSPNADPVCAGRVFEGQQVERHRFEIDHVCSGTTVAVKVDGVTKEIER